MTSSEKLYFAAGKLVTLLAVAAGLALLLAVPIMWAWNYVIPELFGLSTINWGQAWCLHFLSTVLLKKLNSKDKD